MEYGCIGEKLSHSFSKEIHNALTDYDYQLKELTKDELKSFMENKDFKAINVTIPYKEAVMPYLYYISDEAKSIGAVNTIVNRDGKLYGYNTDFFGMKSMIEQWSVDLKGKTVAVLGSGGTSKTAVAVAESMGAKTVHKVSRKEREGFITYEKLNEISDTIEIVINTTPCGMYPNTGVSAIEIKDFINIDAVFDAVYNPLFSKLVVESKEIDAITTGGLYMLVAQAAYAVEHFIGKKLDMNVIFDVYHKLYTDKMNVVLVGMAGCGKTTIGKLLAENLGKKFIDTDDLIVEKENRDIPTIFKEKGEAYFREVEKEVVREISKQNGLVIATGGGVPLNNENIIALKGNGDIFFIDRPLDDIMPTDDRPLSSNRADLEKRYNERYDIYTKCADIVIDGSGTADEVLKRIEAKL